jgi:hypothetical protein
MIACYIGGSGFTDFDKGCDQNSGGRAGMDRLAEISSATEDVIVWLQLLEGIVVLLQEGGDVLPQMIGEKTDLLMANAPVARGKLMQYVSQFICAFFGIATTIKQCQQLVGWKGIEMLFML